LGDGGALNETRATVLVAQEFYPGRAWAALRQAIETQGVSLVHLMFYILYKI
jgi:hypothetical protein